MQWHTLPRRPALPSGQSVTMEDLLDRRSQWMMKDLNVVSTGWAQTHYQQRTKTLLTNTMAVSFWNTRVQDDILFGNLIIVLLPDNCCSQQYTLYACTVSDLDPFLHEVLHRAAATVWDTIQSADTHELTLLHHGPNFHLSAWLSLLACIRTVLSTIGQP